MMKIPSKSADWMLFLVLLVFEVFHLFHLVSGHRMPLGHDGFFYFSMQYFFLNDVAINNEIPLWIPYVNHGITATWFYAIQGAFCPLADALLLTGRMIASVNFLDLFHYGVFVDRLLLLTGVWLLGQRYFSSALTRFFVASCVMASTVTMTQFYFTLHLYYAIPLLLYFGHVFLDTGRWRYFFLACNLFMIQMIGNAAYFIPIISLTIFLYFLFYALDQPSQFCEQIKNLRWGSASVAGIAGGLLSLGLLAGVLLAGNDPAWVNLDVGRNLNGGGTSLHTFLTYAGNMDFYKWKELLLRLSPGLDFTVYMGFLALPLVLFGFLYERNRIKYALALTILILLFFSMGTWVSVFFYYAWPTMKFYRHLALIVPVIKLLLLFLAGFGFEKLFIYRETWQGNRMISYVCLLAGTLLLGLSMVLVEMSSHGHEASRYINAILTPSLPHMPVILDPNTMSIRLSEASIFALLAGILFLLLPLVPFKKYGPVVILLALLINAGDMYGYYRTEMNERTFVLNKTQYSITAFSRMPYAYRRGIDAPNPRQQILSTPLLTRGHLLSTTNAFLFQDALATRYRNIERLKPLHELISALGPPILRNHAFLKIAGSSVDKIQFFNQACFAGDNKQLASYLSDSKYHGDLLFVSGEPAKFVPACPAHEDLTADERLNAAYQIRKFTPNTIELSVNVPFSKPIWMMYSDVWHRRWTAEVNGKPVAVFKADMAYKAIQLPPGNDTVRFEFIAPEIVLLEKIIAVNALLWLLILLYLMTGIFYKPWQYRTNITIEAPKQ